MGPLTLCSMGDCLAWERTEDGVRVWSTRRPKHSVLIDHDEWDAHQAATRAGATPRPVA